MRLAVALASIVLLGIILWDAFEVIILPRRVVRRWRLARFLFILTWPPWVATAKRVVGRARRESFLGVFGPLSLLLLLWMWAFSMVLGFAALHWSLATEMRTPDAATTFGTYVYVSGTTFFTLGLGDVTPRGPVARGLTVVESGLGFGFLALVIGYFPVLYNAFSRREVAITLLDPRAGSPPSLGEMLRRHGRDHFHHVDHFLFDAERWIAELMESHLSYPVLAYFRSQHAHQSWLAALTTILDACALLMAAGPDASAYQARVTFAMARHASVDLAQVFHLEARPPVPDRLAPADAARLFDLLAEAGRPHVDRAHATQRLTDLRRTYEPYVNALGERFLMPLPVWIAPPSR